MLIREEDKNITFTRGLACLMVILVHVGELWYYNSPIYGKEFEFSALSILIGRIAVPLFFMISGYLLFSKKQDMSSRVIIKRFQTMFIPLVYYFLFYYLYTGITGHGFNPINNTFLTKNIAHLWYLGFMLPVYTFSPFISLPKIENQRQALFLLTITSLIFFITETMMTDPYPFNGKYSFNQPLLYMFTGYILKYLKIPDTKQIKALFFIVFILLIQISYFLVLFDKDHSFLMVYPFNKIPFTNILKILEYIFGNQEEILNSYKTFGVYLQAVFLFLFLQSLKINSSNTCSLMHKIYFSISYIAKYSLKIYGWHMLFVQVFDGFVSKINIFIAFPMVFSSALAGSLIMIQMEYRLKNLWIKNS